MKALEAEIPGIGDGLFCVGVNGFEEARGGERVGGEVSGERDI